MKINYRIALWAAYFVLGAFAAGCSRQQSSSNTRSADEAAIREADIAWSKVAEARDVDAMVGYYADEASLFRDNAPIATGKNAIHSSWEESFGMPGFSIHWQPTKVEVANSGDLAYSQGTYDAMSTDPKGNPVLDRGKYVVVWKKQGDGTWKAIADIANSDSLPEVPAK